MTEAVLAAKRRAIRQLHYDASAKIFLQCRRRFWEEDEGSSAAAPSPTCRSATSTTRIPAADRPRRAARELHLVGGRAALGIAVPRRPHVQALEDVAQIHPQVADEFEVGASKMWHDDPYAGGAFALFEPQQALLYGTSSRPKGGIHFAGEHASLAHAWIQGAIESGLRAAREIHQAG